MAERGERNTRVSTVVFVHQSNKWSGWWWCETLVREQTREGKVDKTYFSSTISSAVAVAALFLLDPCDRVMGRDEDDDS